MELIRKYLSADPLQWLLEPSDQEIHYLVQRDIMDQCSDKEYADLIKSSSIVKLYKQSSNGIMGYGNRFDLYYKGALWKLCEAVEYGLDKRTDIVNETASFIVKESQLDSGGFSPSWNPRVASALYTGEIIRVLLQTGIVGDNVTRGIQWIIRNQRHDGGWLYWPVGSLSDVLRFVFFNKPGKGLQREEDTSIPSCPYASLACARALSLYKRRVSILDVAESLNRAVEFFLKNRIYSFGNKPRYNSRLRSNQDFAILGYPLFGQFDIVTALIIIAENGFFHDFRAADAFNIVMSKQNGNGTWNLESQVTGMLEKSVSGNIKDGASKWVTLNVLRMLKEAGKH